MSSQQGTGRMWSVVAYSCSSYLIFRQACGAQPMCHSDEWILDFGGQEVDKEGTAVRGLVAPLARIQV